MDTLRVGPHDAAPGAQIPKKPEVFKWEKYTDDFSHGQPASAFTVYTAIATAFFSSLINLLEPCRRCVRRRSDSDEPFGVAGMQTHGAGLLKV